MHSWAHTHTYTHTITHTITAYSVSGNVLQPTCAQMHSEFRQTSMQHENAMSVKSWPHRLVSYRIILWHTNVLWQRHRVLTVGIITTAAASTCQGMRLTSRLLMPDAWRWEEILPASATKQNMSLSNVSRKSLRFYILYINIIMQESVSVTKIAFVVPTLRFLPRCMECKRDLAIGIITTAAASTCQRLGLTSRLLVKYARERVEIWPASATKENIVLSKVSRKSLRFHIFYVNIIVHTPECVP